MRTIWKMSVTGVLGLTALCKLLSVAFPTKLLLQSDPVLKIPMGHLLLAAGLLEIGVCAFLWFSKNRTACAFTVFGFAVCVLSYRAALYSVGVHFCPCLGNAADWWPWLGKHEGPVMTTIAFWLLLTSLMQLLQRESRDNLSELAVRYPFLSQLIPIVLVAVLFLSNAPWKVFSCGPAEGTEFSRMFFLVHDSTDAHQYAANNPAWFYSRAIASIFSVTGFHFWIPRMITLGIAGGLWLFFLRLMPTGAKWFHLLPALFFFCSWPAVIHMIVEATPQFPASGLAIMGVTLIVPRSAEKWRAGKFIVGVALLVIAIALNPGAILVLPAAMVMLVRQWWPRFHAQARQSGLEPQPAKRQWLIIAGQAAALAILVPILAQSVPVDIKTMSEEPHSSVIATNIINPLSSLSGIIECPGTVFGAFLAFILLWKERRLAEVSFLLLLLITVVLFHFFTPHWPYYILYLAVPLAILAGWGTGELLRRGLQSPALDNQPLRINPEIFAIVGALVAALWLGFEFWNIPGGINEMQASEISARPFMQVLSDYRGRAKWIYVRDGSVAAHAGYILPPELMDIPPYRTLAGGADERSVVETVRRYKCEIIVLETQGELDRQDWSQLVQERYTPLWSSKDEVIFAGKWLNLKPYTAPNELLKSLNL